MSFHPTVPYGTENWHRSMRATMPEGDAFTFTKENRDRLEELASHYAPENRVSAVLHALYLVQDQQGHITNNAVRHVAQHTRIPGFRPGKAPRAIVERVAGRARILEEAKAPLRSDMAQRLTDYDRMFPLGDPPDYEPAQSKSFGAQAAREGRDPRDLIYDYMIEGDGRNFIFAPFANYAAYNLDCCREMMQSPHTLIGLGDGGAHVGLISDGSYPTYLLAHWGRDQYFYLRQDEPLQHEQRSQRSKQS